MDTKGKQTENNTYSIQYKQQVYEFQQGQHAPPVGFFASHYSGYVVKSKVWLENALTERFRAIHKEGAPSKYSRFGTTDQNLVEDEPGNFVISYSGIRIL